MFVLYLILLSFFLSPSFSSFNNPKCKGARYLCGTQNSPNVCVNISDSRGKVHLLQPCSSGKYCPFSSIINTTKTNVTCVSKPITNITNLPGEYCSNNQDCLSLKCENGICKGKLQCSSHSDCDPRHYCDSTQNLCLAQKTFGQVFFH